MVIIFIRLLAGERSEILVSVSGLLESLEELSFTPKCILNKLDPRRERRRKGGGSMDCYIRVRNL